MNFGIVLISIFGVIWAALMMFASDVLTNLLLLNAVLQLVLFVSVACVPFLRTGRMSYVDIAWPF